MPSLSAELSHAHEALPHADPIIRFANVSKTFAGRSGAATAALDNISLDIRRGEIFSVIGYSGAGKSTLVRLINGLEKVSSGTVTVDGVEISALSERLLAEQRQHIGMIFQQFNLLRSRTVFGNIEFPLRVTGTEKVAREERVWELLDFVGLTEKAWAYPEQLSGGQRQRVGIARALAAHPKVLLADEATSALDPETTKDVLELLRRTNRELGVAVVVITHEMEVVRALADRVAVLDSGRLVELGSTFDVFAHPQAQMTRSFLSTVSQTAPDPEQIRTLHDRGAKRLVTITVDDTTDVGALLSETVAVHGVTFRLLFGGIDILQRKQFGALTVEFIGAPEAVDAAIASVASATKVEEVSR